MKQVISYFSAQAFKNVNALNILQCYWAREIYALNPCLSFGFQQYTCQPISTRYFQWVWYQCVSAIVRSEHTWKEDSSVGGTILEHVGKKSGVAPSPVCNHDLRRRGRLITVLIKATRLTDAWRNIWWVGQKKKKKADGKFRKSHLGQPSYVQVEADDEDVPGHPQSGPYCILEGRDTDRLAP